MMKFINKDYKMGKFTRHPNTDIERINKDELQNFLSGASVTTKPQEVQYPWEKLDDMEKTKGLNLRLTKADLAKLQYISEHTPYSQQKFIYENLKIALEAKIEELIKTR